MNRPLKDIIYIDYTDEQVAMHKENAIIIPQFEGETTDRDLIDLIPFLERKLKYCFYLIIFPFRFGCLSRRCP